QETELPSDSHMPGKSGRLSHPRGIRRTGARLLEHLVSASGMEAFGELAGTPPEARARGVIECIGAPRNSAPKYYSLFRHFIAFVGSPHIAVHSGIRQYTSMTSIHTA